MRTKIVQKFGNGGHIVLPKEYIGKRIRFIAEPKTFEDIKSEIMEILKPYLENILGVYLYGSYARNEQTIDSDIDILVITNTKLKVIDKIDNYSIISVTTKAIENTLKTNAVLILPILREAKTIINPVLLNGYKEYKFTRSNIKFFVDSCKKVLELNKKGLELEFEIGSIIYSLMLRIRSLLMIKIISNNLPYSKTQLSSYLERNGLTQEKIQELYRIYSNERNGGRIKKSDSITKEDIQKLILIVENMLQEVKSLIL